MNHDDFISAAREKFGDQFQYGEYLGYCKEIIVTCINHSDFKTIPYRHLKSDNGCCKTCNFEKKNTAHFFKKARDKFGDKYQYGEFTGYLKQIEVTCPHHGIFTMGATSHLRYDGCSKCTEMKKFIAKSRKKYGDRYEYGVYTDWDTRVEIICPDHGSQMMKPDWHLQSKTGCTGCAQSKPRKTTEQYIRDAREVHGDKYEYGEYEHALAPIDIYCSIHGKFTQIADSHLQGNGCADCSGNIKIDRDEFIRRSNIKHNNKFDYSKLQFNNVSDNVIIICPDHGEFTTAARTHMKRGVGCRACSNKEFMTYERFVSKAREVHGDKYEYPIDNDFSGAEYKALIKCPNHGEFRQLVGNHISAKNGCPKCQTIISKSETEYLDSLGLPNDPQHRQVRIKSPHKPRGYLVDGLDPVTKTVYEFDGDFWHGNPALYDQNAIQKRAKKTFGELYQNTLLKKKHLEEAGYTVISIWESDWKLLNNT